MDLFAFYLHVELLLQLQVSDVSVKNMKMYLHKAQSGRDLKSTSHNALLLCLQPVAESVATDVTSSEGRGRVPLHLPVFGRLLPAVPGVVVLL